MKINLLGKIVGATIISIAVLVIAVMYIAMPSETYIYKGETLVQDKDYHHIEPGQSTCLALTSECGYCRGQVVDKICYVSKKHPNQSAN